MKMRFLNIFLSLSIFAMGGCDTLAWDQMSRGACEADRNCSYICPDGSRTNPRNPVCPDPTMGKTGTQ